MKGDAVLVMGAGGLGGALARGLAREPRWGGRLRVCDIDAAKASALADATGAQVFAPGHGGERIAVLLLAVKPPDVAPALQSVTPHLDDASLVVSCAAGVSIAAILAALGREHKVLRAMPNVAAQVGAATTAVCAGPGVVARDRELVEDLLGAIGRVHPLADEASLHAVTALAASGPAFAALLIEALEDAGVRAGLPRALAQQLTAEMIQGTLALLQAGQTPAQLRAAVTSPAGTTAAGLAVLERAAVRGALGDAVAAAAERSRQLAG